MQRKKNVFGAVHRIVGPWTNCIWATSQRIIIIIIPVHVRMYPRVCASFSVYFWCVYIYIFWKTCLVKLLFDVQLSEHRGGMVGVESPCELYPMHLQSNCNHRCGVDDGDGQCYMWVGWCNKLHTVDFYCSMFARCVRVATNLSKNFVLFHSFHVVALAAHMHSCVINDCWWLGWLNKLTAKATSHYTLLGQPMYHWQSSAHSALVMQSIFLKHCNFM